MLEHQPLHAEGREADIFTILLRVRYSNKQLVSIFITLSHLSGPMHKVDYDPTAQVMEATNTIRDSLANQIEPVYGLTTMHAALLAFQAEPAPASAAAPAETKSATYAYGLIALGKFILKLPAEILEEELPRMKTTLITVRVLFVLPSPSSFPFLLHF